MPDPDLAECVNDRCPWSGEPVRADSLTEYRGHVVGFCNAGCRDKFERALGEFERLLSEKTKVSAA